MHSILRTVFKGSSFRNFSNIIRQSQSESFIPSRQFTRNLWHMSKMNENGINKNLELFKSHSQSTLCSCGCNRKNHTSGEKELADFLKEEIAQEKKLLKSNTLPSEVCGFKVQLDGSEVTLTKTVGEETIEVMFCVNHSVDAESEPEIAPTMDKPEFGEMVSKPEFEVEIRRGKETLGMTCSFIQSGAQTEEEYRLFSFGRFKRKLGSLVAPMKPTYWIKKSWRNSSAVQKMRSLVVPIKPLNWMKKTWKSSPSHRGLFTKLSDDLFSIEDVVLYEGEWKETNYAVSGAVLDGYLYDILMNFLADKGITNEFVEKLSEFSTIYEHNLYISFLEGLRKFSSK
ncbi:complement component 1 Q subcomponent-binding protein, mitochondrial isoform X1 [Nilaparvata lugens]|uniref:complement component 1 Q subcomponent-binding protein, mitochondrial isoform X1 n=1 Tax=Nilaparvata lugens TaxID=108931 RepID=UPI00193D0EA7|nr:complement component 1 Q subcomponent-binding protein, mitochondrial isoform X1 [Nilaparvata lugens]